MPPREPSSAIDALNRLMSIALTTVTMLYLIDVYDQSHGGPGVKERIAKLIPKRKKKVRWEELSLAEREHLKRRVIVEAWNAAEGRYEKF